MSTFKFHLPYRPLIGLTAVALPLILILSGCAPSIKTRADYDSDHDFSQLKTFDWLKPGGNAANPMEKHPIIAKKVKRAITAEMEGKGYSLDVANPDFHIVFFGSTEDKLEVQSWGSPYAGWGYRGWVYGWGAPDVTVDQYKEATLVVDIIDAKSGELVWRGSGKGRVQQNAKNKMKKRQT